MKKTFPLLLAVAVAVGAGCREGRTYVDVVRSTPGLLGCWRFDTASASNSCVADHTGLLQGKAIIGPPHSGLPLGAKSANRSLLLGGNGDYAVTSLTSQIDTQGTILAWVYLTAYPSARGRIFEIAGQPQFGNDFDMQIEKDNGLRFYTDSGSCTSYSNPLPLNSWHFLAATFIAHSNRCLYLDGELVASSPPGEHHLNPNAFYIGENPVFPGRFFEGRMEGVAVFNRALGAGEISRLAAAARRTSKIATLAHTVMPGVPIRSSDPERAAAEPPANLDPATQASSDEQTEHQVVITAPAKFESRGSWLLLIISNSVQTYTIPWSIDPRFKGGLALESNRLYTFTVIGEPSTSITVPVTKCILPDVVRVRKEGNVIYDGEVCEVHHAKMQRRQVPISYGLPCAPGNDEPTPQIELTQFPHRHEFALGGCIVMTTSPRTRDAYVCSLCKAGYQKWKKEYGESQK